MASSLLGLNTALRGILAHQAALNTVGHNIANASTDGYSRQGVPLSASTPIGMPGLSSIPSLGVIGTGVDTSPITRSRNQFLDFQFRAQNKQLGFFEEVRNTLRQVDAVFGEPADTAMGGLMQTFADSFQDIQNVPEDPATRTANVEAGENLAFLIRHSYDELVRMQSDLDIRVTNSITVQIASLNAQAAVGAGANTPANDILDKRDFLLDRLSKIVGTNVTYRADGMVDVQVNNLHLVSGVQTYSLSTTTNVTTTFLDIVYSPNSTTIVPTSGTLGGLLQARDTDIGGVATGKGILTRLNNLASNMITEVNKIHRGGFGIETTGAKNVTNVTSVLGSTGVYTITSDGSGNLSATHTPTGGSASATVTGAITAGGTNSTLIPGITLSAPSALSRLAGSTTITVTDGLVVAAGAITVSIVYTPVGGTASAAVTKSYVAGAANTNFITGLTITMDAASNLTNGGVDFVTTGNNFFDDILQTAGVAALGSVSFTEYHQSTIAALGSDTRASTISTENQEDFLSLIETSRQSVSGVSIDEETANIIRFQLAFEGSARLMTAIDEMLELIVNRLGIVGR